MLSFDIIKTKENISEITNAQLSITNWIQAFLNIGINTCIITLKYNDGIIHSINGLRDEAKKWLEALGHDISDYIPQGIYDFANYFSNITPEILSLVETVKRNKFNNMGEIKKRELMQLLTMLYARAIDQKYAIERFKIKFDTFLQNIKDKIRELPDNLNSMNAIEGLAEEGLAEIEESVQVNSDQVQNTEEQMTTLQGIKASLGKFDKAASHFAGFLPEVCDMWDTLIRKIIRDIQILKQPDTDVAMVKDLQTLSEAAGYWKALEPVAQV